MRQGAHHLQAPRASALHNPLLGQGIGASSLPAPPLVTTRAGTDVLAQRARRTVCAAGGCGTRSLAGRARHKDTERFVGRKRAAFPASGLDAARRNALLPIAPGADDAAAMHNLPQRDYRLNLRPARARRLSEAGRHWAPIARQRATREERHSGRTWPTYCNKPNWAPPVMDGMVRTVAHGDRAVKPKNVFLIGRLS